MADAQETEILDIYNARTGVLVGMGEFAVCTDAEIGPMANVGGIWTPYRPKLSAGGATGRADVGPLVARAAGY